MAEPTLTDATNVWCKLIKDTFQGGHEISPRGKRTVERLAVTSVVNMAEPIVMHRQRFKEGQGYRFMPAEAAWILSGDDRVETIAPYAKHIVDFSDDGIRFFGAYGPPINDQFDYVVRTLTEDPTSRQAVMTIWRQNPPYSRDIPCTVSLQWLIRQDLGIWKLHCVASMRSSDCWLGWPYDVFNFSMLSRAVLRSISSVNPFLGNLYLTAASQHIYEPNLNGVIDCFKEPADRFMKHHVEDLNYCKTREELTEVLWQYAQQGGLVYD